MLTEHPISERVMSSWQALLLASGLLLIAIATDDLVRWMSLGFAIGTFIVWAAVWPLGLLAAADARVCRHVRESLFKKHAV